MPRRSSVAEDIQERALAGCLGLGAIIVVILLVGGYFIFRWVLA